MSSSGMAFAAFGYKGWQRFSKDFKAGYLTGFLDMANLARNLHPYGWVDQKYPQVPKAKPLDWVMEVDRLYKEPENQGYTITSLLQAASRTLQDKFGKPKTPEQRILEKMQYQMEAVKKRRKEQALAKKSVQAGSKAPAVQKKPASQPPPHERKWCRCDGKDPKAERARRRAEREAKQAAGKAAAGTAPAAAKAGSGEGKAAQ